MSVETAVSAWRGLEDLAGPRARVHITGGEPFLYFDRLCEIMLHAKNNRLRPAETIETSAAWATDDRTIAQRLALLDDLGFDRLKISWDPFHAEFVEKDSVHRLFDNATRILGPDRVLVRWQKYLQQPVKSCSDTDGDWPQTCLSAVNDYPCRFTGRAARTIAELFASKTIESIASENCASDFLSAKGIHIDPFGNVFSGLCSGINLGNVNSTPLPEMWRRFDPSTRDFFTALFHSGPAAFLPQAIDLAYAGPALYADKCHLCTALRDFFFDNNRYKTIIAPAECYYDNLRTQSEKLL
jgi:hypothetical protein